MTAARTDRLIVVLTAAILTAWSACLVHLWCAASDSSGESFLMSVSSLLLTVPPGLAIAGRLLRRGRRFLDRRAKLARHPQAPRRTGGDAPHVMRRLFGASILWAVLCGLAALTLIPAARWLLDLLDDAIVWTRAPWLAATLLLRVAFLLPMGVGLASAMSAGAMIRRGSGRDVYASLFRQWLAGAAAGLLLVALVWWGGADLPAFSVTMPVLLVALGAATLWKGASGVRPPQAATVPVTDSRPPRTYAIWATFGAMAAALAAQSRLAGDVLGLSFAARLVWVAASLGATVLLLRKEDHKAGPAVRTREISGLLGLASVWLMQCALAVTALRSGFLGVFCAAAACGSQVVLCVLAAGVLSRQRRAHALGGGTAQSYFGGACGGAGAGVLCCLLAGWLPGGIVGLLGVILATLAWGGCREVFLSPRRGDQARWAACSSLLLTATMAALLIAVHRVGSEFGTIRVGAWLSCREAAAGPESKLHAGPGGDPGAAAPAVLPPPAPFRDPQVSAVVAEVLSRASSRGCWWFAATSAADLPAELPWGITATVSAPDVSAAAWTYGGGRGPRLPPQPFFQVARSRHSRFDGVLLALLPADHPEAWRCYNESALQLALASLHPRGAVLLRTQAAGGGGRSGGAMVLSVASTFRRTVGSGWGAISTDRDGRIDALLAGPAGAVEQPPARPGVTILPLETLLAPPLDAPPIRLAVPQPWSGRRLDERWLLQRLANQRGS